MAAWSLWDGYSRLHLISQSNSSWFPGIRRCEASTLYCSDGLDYGRTQLSTFVGSFALDSLRRDLDLRFPAPRGPRSACKPVCWKEAREELTGSSIIQIEAKAKSEHFQVL
ncbi:hypothetical protein MPTK1_7g00630 [Marchantia polymorpha subsp. ruderalis]|uniref:Uncharacterized protein n=2 Tax=Marchantia polymorpha TaxID=3197 RepID=A0AAF6BUT4_MARPO|nr:hypothetical protein MARPO_0046s0062 [Marchantia polymorpha]BBN15768.1 hypothetical protein Mp_7g00630 [Marchantia polymorpha subsp. ruderalis]|eukprot:PTQ39240.1 hypothetical protein MARPO_0046s0062 [Marchantia polymorpha]